jgi:hypothetical protein
LQCSQSVKIATASGGAAEHIQVIGGKRSAGTRDDQDGQSFTGAWK